MAISFISHISVALTGTGTTSAINTTNANLLVAAISNGGSPGISDSKNNTWTPLTTRTNASFQTRLYYVLSPIVGTNHTFSITGGSYNSLMVAAFSGISAFDAENGADLLGSVSSFQSGSLTPANNGELIVTSIGTSNEPTSGGFAIDSSFTVTDSENYDTNSQTNYAGGLAYLIQASKVIVNPTWSWGGGNAGGAVAAIAAFTAASSGSSVSGNAGVAGATVSYSGTSSGSVTADGSGNYTISSLVNGPYTITPSLTGYNFAPTSQNVTVSGSNITGINFGASNAYSVPDCRVLKPNNATSRLLNGTLIFDVQTSSNAAVPGTDSRAAGAPTASGTYPQNSRTPGTYGPGE
jgi:hypothetical protein